MPIEVMQTFVTVVRLRSIRGAAHALGYSASAVSRQMSQLQRQLGVQLFEPEGRGITPTRQAIQLEARATPLLLEARSFNVYLTAVRSAGRLPLDEPSDQDQIGS